VYRHRTVILGIAEWPAGSIAAMASRPGSPPIRKEAQVDTDPSARTPIASGASCVHARQDQADRARGIARRVMIGSLAVGAVSLLLTVAVPSLLEKDAIEAKNRKRRRRRKRRRNGPSATATPTETGTPTP
jgi:hypothetical protein